MKRRESPCISVRAALLLSLSLSLSVFGSMAASLRAAIVNVAPLGVASQSTTGFGGEASRGNDGNTSGVFGNNSVTHTADLDPAPAWEVDLGEDYTLTSIKIWNRTDVCCPQRLTHFRVLVLAADRSEVWSEVYFADQTFPDTLVDGFEVLPADGTTGRIVRIERVGPDIEAGLWLSLAEVQVFSDLVEPEIVTQPQGATAEELRCHRFTVGLINIEDAVAVTYQWKKDGGDVPGANGPELFLSPLALDDTGSYTVEIDVDGTPLVSDAAVLTVTRRSLSRGRPASQLSTAFSGDAARAVDGNTNGAYGGNSVTHTDNTPLGWWEVDLGAGVTVDEIVIWGRSDCCGNRLSNFRVSLLDADRVEVFGGDFFTDMTFPDPALGGFAVNVGALAGQFVRIARLGPDDQSNNYLSLAEVQVFGDGPLPEAPLSLARVCGVIARQSTTNGGFAPSLAIDGSLGNFTHTLGTDTASTWEAVLVEESEIGAIVIYNRTSCCGSRLRDIIVSILDDDGDVVYESELLNPENVLGVFPNGPTSLRVDLQFGDPGIILGRTVRIARIADPDLSGSGGMGNADESNVLSMAEVEIYPPAECPPTGDTHCGGITVTAPADNGPGLYMLSAAATDESGDEIAYTLHAESDAGAIIDMGPQATGEFSLRLGLGAWTVSVAVDDSPTCPDEAEDGVCTTTIDVTCPKAGNIAIGGVATQSTLGFGGVPERAIDCNTDGVYNNGSMTHTADLDPAPWWELDLLSPAAIDRIVLYNRTDCCGERLSNFRVALLDQARATVWSEDFFTAGGAAGPSLVIDGVRGETGQIVRVENLGPSPGGVRYVSLAEVEVYEFSCPADGDTHCGGLTVAAGKGGWVASASATDDSGDAISYTFTATADGADPITVGPQAESEALLALTPGTWTVTVSVDDDPLCPDTAGDATCSTTVTVPPPGGRRVPGDCNDDGKLDVSDASCVFGVLFTGVPELFPCGTGVPGDAANVVLLDWQPDLKVDIADGIGILNFLFSGGPAHPLAIEGDEIFGCVTIEGCDDGPVCSE